LNDVATLLDQGIDADVVAKLIENSANLRNIAVNVQILLDEGTRVDLINKWFCDESDLNDAIAILNQRVDLSLRKKDKDILKQAKEILTEQKPHEKDYRLESLSQILEYHDGLNEADIVEALRLLLPAALQEEDKVAKETFFSTINTAVIHHTIEDRIDWDALAASLSSLEAWNLEYALSILGLSGEARYLPILNEYTHHADPEIREDARDAIREIEYRVAHAAPARKAG